jgi:uncharacterized protein YcbK (DUF882 family)
MSIYITRNFKQIEFACPCCGKVKPLNPRFIYLLQNLREKINRSIFISRGGGLRCKKYNRKIGGYKYSPHLKGIAVDIHAKNMNLIQLAKEAKEIGFTRIGLYPYSHFIHIDILEPRPSRAWIRNKEGIYYYFTTLEDAIKCVGYI